MRDLFSNSGSFSNAKLNYEAPPRDPRAEAPRRATALRAVPRPRGTPRGAAEVAGAACGAAGVRDEDDPGGEFHVIGVLEILGAFFFWPAAPVDTTSMACPCGSA